MPVENFLNKKTKRQIVSRSARQTKQFGEKLAKEFLAKNNTGQAIVIGLQGELGAGKTTFLQGFAKGLGIKEQITSPTFVLMKRFTVPRQLRNFYHFDCYRIDQPSEILELGWQEIISNPENIVAIEWPERIQSLLPKNTFWLRFRHKDENQREIIVH